MQQTAEIVDEVMSAFGQKVSIPKTKVMQVIRKGNTIRNREDKIECKISGKEIEVVDSFQYVGTQVKNNTCMTKEITMRTKQMRVNYFQYGDTVFKNHRMELWNKLTMFRIYVLPAGLYNCEAWHASYILVKKLDSIAREYLLRIIGFKWQHFVSYDYIIKLCRLLGSDMLPVSILASKYRLNFFGRIIRSKDTNLCKQLLYGEYVGGSRPVGRPEKQWIDCIVQDIKQFFGYDDPKEKWNEIKTLAMDEEAWDVFIESQQDEYVLLNWYKNNSERRKARMRKQGKRYEICREEETDQEESVHEEGDIGAIEELENEEDLQIIEKMIEEAQNNSIERSPLQSSPSETIPNLVKTLGFKKAKDLLDTITQRGEGKKREMGEPKIWTTQCVTHGQKRNSINKKLCLDRWDKLQRLITSGKERIRQAAIDEWLPTSNYYDKVRDRDELFEIQSIDRYSKVGRKERYLVRYELRVFPADIDFPEDLPQIQGLPWRIDKEYIDSEEYWYTASMLKQQGGEYIVEQMENAREAFALMQIQT